MGMNAGGISLPVSGAALLPAATPALGRGQKAAREFEAQLIGQMLGSMEKTFANLPGQGEVAGEDNFNDLGTQALAQAIAAGGGFGIAKLIGQHLIGQHLISQHLGVAEEKPEGALPAARKPAPDG
jgi:Rod binding domain-containing protein